MRIQLTEQQFTKLKYSIHEALVIPHYTRRKENRLVSNMDLYLNLGLTLNYRTFSPELKELFTRLDINKRDIIKYSVGNVLNNFIKVGRFILGDDKIRKINERLDFVENNIDSYVKYKKLGDSFGIIVESLNIDINDDKTCIIEDERIKELVKTILNDNPKLGLHAGVTDTSDKTSKPSVGTHVITIVDTEFKPNEINDKKNTDHAVLKTVMLSATNRYSIYVNYFSFRSDIKKYNEKMVSLNKSHEEYRQKFIQQKNIWSGKIKSLNDVISRLDNPLQKKFEDLVYLRNDVISIYKTDVPKEEKLNIFNKFKTYRDNVKDEFINLIPSKEIKTNFEKWFSDEMKIKL